MRWQLCMQLITVMPCLLYSLDVLQDLNSFPTRRSSDLLLVDQKHSWDAVDAIGGGERVPALGLLVKELRPGHVFVLGEELLDRKSTRLNSSHPSISYAVFCLKKKNPSQLHQVDPTATPE